MKLIMINTHIEIPNIVARCPICNDTIVIEDIDEWQDLEMGIGRVTESGLHVTCVTEPDIDSDTWDDWFNAHWRDPYTDWLPIRKKVYRWFDVNYRLKLDRPPPPSSAAGRRRVA